MKRILFAMSLMAATTASFAQVAKPMEDVNHVIDNTVDSLNKAMTARIVPGTSRKGNNPVLFLIGNSTMRNGTLGNGNNGQWGWGYYEHEFFDENKITVENQALAPANFFILQFSLVCCIIIPVLLSLVYSYTDDFQPQGRYIMTFIIPVMYFTAAGTERVLTLCFRKWMVPLLMLPLLYAVVHVWVSAFLSVYIPAWCESLSFLSGLRFPWLSNIGPVVKLLQLLIPG